MQVGLDIEAKRHDLVSIFYIYFFFDIRFAFGFGFTGWFIKVWLVLVKGSCW